MAMDNRVVQFAVAAASAVGSRFPGSDWYLFGSSANDPENAGDIDLLMVHDDHVDSSHLRSELADLCLALPLHLTILTRAEEAELKFIAKAGGCRQLCELVEAS